VWREVLYALAVLLAKKENEVFCTCVRPSIVIYFSTEVTKKKYEVFRSCNDWWRWMWKLVFVAEFLFISKRLKRKYSKKNVGKKLIA
jgi:hypothetical protein